MPARTRTSLTVRASGGRPEWPQRGLSARAFFLASLIAAAAGHSSASAEETSSNCGPLYDTGHYGPFDYRTHQRELSTVERNHMSKINMRSREGDLAGELSYTLMASPNHHRALAMQIELDTRLRGGTHPQAKYSTECWFDRAIRFTPNDVIVRMLYAHYLSLSKRADDAVRQLQLATELAGDSGMTHYNVGLVYFELGRYDQALASAHTAMSLGYVKRNLEAELRRVDKWREP